MKSLFKPRVVCGSIAIPLFLLGFYWFMAKGEMGEKLVTVVGGVLIILASSILVWGYSSKKEELNKKELLLLMGISIAIGVGIVWLLSWSINLFSEEEQSFTFASINMMVVIVINLISCVAFSYSIKKSRQLRKYVTVEVGIPFIMYLGFNILAKTQSELLIVILLVAGLYSFVLVGIQILFILKRDRGICFFPSVLEERKTKIYYEICTFVILIVLPYIGLAVNSIDLLSNEGLLGDFSEAIFWIMPLINGLAFMMWPPKAVFLRKILFYVRVVGATFILYFFVIFIPLMPIGVIGIIFFGLGLLIFIPTVAIIWEGCYLVREVKALWQTESKNCISLLVLGALTLPSLFFGGIGLDRYNFDTAMRYVEGKEIEGSVNKEQLAKTLDRLEKSMMTAGRRDILDGGNTPILSYFYHQGLTKDHVIDETTFNRMRVLFLGEEKLNKVETLPPAGDIEVKLTDVTASTTYDNKQDIYRSWVDLTLENPTTKDRLEYTTTISLPDNAYVSDYYLVVGKEKKKGILADQRAATEVYQTIVRKSLDPGLLKYFNDDTLELRVFPFASKEIRKTGFEVIHTGATTLQIGDHELSLRETSESLQEDYSIIKTEEVTILSGDYTKTLPKAETLIPRYYFLIDGSEKAYREGLALRAERYIEKHHLEDVEVWVVEEGILSKGIENVGKAPVGDGGYNFNGALQKILREEKEGYYPVVIAVTFKFSQALEPYRLGDLGQRYPQSSYYYELGGGDRLRPYPLYKGVKSHTETTEIPLVSDVRSYEGQPVLNSGSKQFIYTKPLTVFKSTKNSYKDGCLLEAIDQFQTLSQEELVQVVRGSFTTRLLTKQTAFIVVETKEQEEELLKCQEEYISGKKQLQSQMPSNMAEPPILLCMVILLASVSYFKKRQSSQKKNV